MVQRLVADPLGRRRYGRLFQLLVLANVVVGGWAVYDETWGRRPWKRFGAAIQQVCIPALGVRDRCQTCHPRVERRHPGDGRLIARHPPERFGCTVCHDGQGMQTKGVAHRPFRHGHDDPSWPAPLLPRALVYSTCARCHEPAALPAGTESYARGRALYDERCHPCHTSDAPRRPGPTHAGLAHKVRAGWLERYLREPPTAARRMPGFGLGEAEARALAAYLVSLPGPAPATARTAAGDPVRGQALLRQRGCLGCHPPTAEEDDEIAAAARFAAVGGAGAEDDPFSAPSSQPAAAVDPVWRIGPSLAGARDKLRPAWLRQWLLKPRALFPATRMPDLGLTEAEAADLAAHLLAGAPPDVAPPADETRVAEGRRLAARLGCASCHEQPGAVAGPVGPSLHDFGRKPPSELDFGGVARPPAAAAWVDYTRTKLRSPRAFARPGAPLSMPDPALPETDREALVVYLKSLTGEVAPPGYAAPASPPRRALAAGEAIVSRHGCRGCHSIAGRGGAIARHFPEPALGPPLLDGEGRRVQPAWLFAFMAEPTRLRGWLAPRMPSFQLAPDEVEALVHFFRAEASLHTPFDRDTRPSYRVTPPARPGAQALFAKLRCRQCHRLGEPGVKVAELAPDLGLAHDRLRPEWLDDFIQDPQRLLPGTRMPTFYPVNEDTGARSSPAPTVLDGHVKRQVRALVGLVLEERRSP